MAKIINIKILNILICKLFILSACFEANKTQALRLLAEDSQRLFPNQVNEKGLSMPPKNDYWQKQVIDYQKITDKLKSYNINQLSPQEKQLYLQATANATAFRDSIGQKASHQRNPAFYDAAPLLQNRALNASQTKNIIRAIPAFYANAKAMINPKNANAGFEKATAQCIAGLQVLDSLATQAHQTQADLQGIQAASIALKDYLAFVRSCKFEFITKNNNK